MADKNTNIIFIWVNFGSRGFTRSPGEVGIQIRILNRQKPPKGRIGLVNKSIVRLVEQSKILKLCTRIEYAYTTFRCTALAHTVKISLSGFWALVIQILVCTQSQDFGRTRLAHAVNHPRNLDLQMHTAPKALEIKSFSSTRGQKDPSQRGAFVPNEDENANYKKSLFLH